MYVISTVYVISAVKTWEAVVQNPNQIGEIWRHHTQRQFRCVDIGSSFRNKEFAAVGHPWMPREDRDMDRVFCVVFVFRGLQLCENDSLIDLSYHIASVLFRDIR